MDTSTSTRNKRIIRASREALYQAFLDPKALAVWLPPGEMTGEVHYFDSRVNGGYHMSLFYPASEPAHRGKTAEREDSFTSRFLELMPSERIVQAITFVADDPAFYGQMTLEATFSEAGSGTEVTITCMDIPPGIRPEDNEAGCQSSLEKLARYVEPVAA